MKRPVQFALFGCRGAQDFVGSGLVTKGPPEGSRAQGGERNESRSLADDLLGKRLRRLPAGQCGADLVDRELGVADAEDQIGELTQFHCVGVVVQAAVMSEDLAERNGREPDVGALLDDECAQVSWLQAHRAS